MSRTVAADSPVLLAEVIASTARRFDLDQAAVRHFLVEPAASAAVLDAFIAGAPISGIAGAFGITTDAVRRIAATYRGDTLAPARQLAGRISPAQSLAARLTAIRVAADFGIALAVLMRGDDNSRGGWPKMIALARVSQVTGLDAHLVGRVFRVSYGRVLAAIAQAPRRSVAPAHLDLLWPARITDDPAAGLPGRAGPAHAEGPAGPGVAFQSGVCV